MKILTGLSSQETQDTFTQLLSEFGINENPSKILTKWSPCAKIMIKYNKKIARTSRWGLLCSPLALSTP